MKATMHFFWSPTCSHCPPARKVVKELAGKRDDFTLIEYEPGTLEAKDKFLEFNVSSTPTFIIQGPAYKDNIGLRGGQSEAVLNKYLDIALGKREIDNKSGFLQKLISFIRIN